MNIHVEGMSFECSLKQVLTGNICLMLSDIFCLASSWKAAATIFFRAAAMICVAKVDELWA
jgi:hypothetical protein